MPKFLINRDFARLWYGQAISTIGDYVFDTTLVVWVATVLYRTNDRVGPIAVSGLVLCVVLATALVGPAAGVFVDRWSHRRIMLGSEAIRFVLVGALTLVTLIPVHDLPPWAWMTLLYAVTFLVNTAEQFFNPARFATIGDVVHGEVDRTRAFGLGQATSATAAIIGPPLAAPLLFAAGLQWALLLNTLSYAVSYLAIRSVRFPEAVPRPETMAGPAPKPTSWRTDFVAGLRMFVRNRFLVAIALIAIFAQLGTGPLNTLDVYFLRDNLHSSQNLLGVLSMGMGAGAIIGALIAGQVVKRIGARNTTWLGLFLTGALVVVFARQSVFGIAVVALFVMAIPLTALNTALMPQLLAVTPKDFIGRMNAVLLPLIQLSSTVSIMVSAWLASTVLLHFHATLAGQHFGRIDTLFVAGGVVIVAAGVYAYFTLPPSEATGEAGTEAGGNTGGEASGDASPTPAIPAPANPVEQIDVGAAAVIAATEQSKTTEQSKATEQSDES